MATPCPPAVVQIDRSFSKQPPVCVDRLRDLWFEFKCTPDPNRTGYCLESHGVLGVEAATAISEQLLCAQRLAEWVNIERQARADNEHAS